MSSDNRAILHTPAASPDTVVHAAEVRTDVIAAGDEASAAAAGNRSGAGGTQRAHQAQRAILAQLRHDLRTPLNAIIGYADMLLDDTAAQDAPHVADLQRIRAAGGELLTLIEAILGPERMAAGTLDLEAVGSALRHDLRTPINAIIGYGEMLLEDAALGQDDRIPDLERILSAARRFLALIDDIVRAATSDDDTVARELEGAGTAAMVKDALSSIGALAQDARAAARDSAGRLLVVDDNAINRDVLARHLERQGHTVAVAEHGRQALEMLAAQPFDLVLLDVMMPEMNGYQVLQRLKADVALRDIPVIMISALDEIESAVRCIELGAEDYLPKPFNPVLLRARVGAGLEKKRLRAQEVVYLRQIEEEQRRADALLHIILPAEIVAELKATNGVQPCRYENVAVLFCDIVGFTPYCDRHEPHEVVTHLQRLVEAYEDVVVRHEMQKIKTIGDAFMAAAGLLKPVENPVLRSVRCGLEMIATVQRLLPQWNVRVGIHVGPVVAGVLGRRQYLFDLWGDTVNTAARIEKHGSAGTITLSKPAWQQVAGLCEGESLGVNRVKGKGDLEMFRFKRFTNAGTP